MTVIGLLYVAVHRHDVDNALRVGTTENAVAVYSQRDATSGLFERQQARMRFTPRHSIILSLIGRRVAMVNKQFVRIAARGVELTVTRNNAGD